MADFTVADVLEWARTKPADGTYLYDEPRGCALALFLKETGRAIDPAVGTRDWCDLDTDQMIGYPFERKLDLAVSHARTFGALVKRLEAIVQETPAKPSLWLTPQAYLDSDCGKVPA